MLDGKFCVGSLAGVFAVTNKKKQAISGFQFMRNLNYLHNSVSFFFQ